MSLAGLGQSDPALRLAGAVKAECERLGVDPHMRFWDELLAQYLGKAIEALTGASGARLRTTGPGTVSALRTGDVLLPPTSA